MPLRLTLLPQHDIPYEHECDDVPSLHSALGYVEFNNVAWMSWHELQTQTCQDMLEEWRAREPEWLSGLLDQRTGSGLAKDPPILSCLKDKDFDATALLERIRKSERGTAMLEEHLRWSCQRDIDTGRVSHGLGAPSDGPMALLSRLQVDTGLLPDRLVWHKQRGGLVHEDVPKYLTQTDGDQHSNCLREERHAVSQVVQVHAAAMADSASVQQIPHLIGEWHLSTAQVEEPQSGYASVDAFLARQFLPSARPVACPEDPTVAICPCDAKVSAYRSLAEAEVDCQKRCHIPIEAILGVLPTETAKGFRTGSLLLCRLALRDPHRYASPVVGRGVAIHQDPEPSTMVVHEMVTDPGTFGSVLVAAIGAPGTPRPLTSPTAMAKDSRGAPVPFEEKGTQMGTWSFGGTAIAIFFKHGRVDLDPLLLRLTEYGLESAIKAGTQVAKAKDRTSRAWLKATPNPKAR